MCSRLQDGGQLHSWRTKGRSRFEGRGGTWWRHLEDIESLLPLPRGDVSHQCLEFLCLLCNKEQSWSTSSLTNLKCPTQREHIGFHREWGTVRESLKRKSWKLRVVRVERFRCRALWLPSSSLRLLNHLPLPLRLRGSLQQEHSRFFVHTNQSFKIVDQPNVQKLVLLAKICSF